MSNIYTLDDINHIISEAIKSIDQSNRDKQALIEVVEYWKDEYTTLFNKFADLKYEYERLENENYLLKTGKFGAEDQFTLEELERMRRLCHPDKHGGSVALVKATTKLNKLCSQVKN